MDISSVISLPSKPPVKDSAVRYITIVKVPVANNDENVNILRGILSNDKTPNCADKVENWMKVCDYTEPPDVVDNESQTHTCIRYDFDKTPKIRRPIVPNHFTMKTPLLYYMEEAKKKRAQLNNCHVTNNFTPLSPESQKKELCNYLQLMKPEDKLKQVLAKYRRSRRSKTQQRELKGGEKHATLKSDMKQKMKKLFSLEQNKEEKIVLPLPPKRIYAEVTDFEDSVKSLVQDHVQTVVNGSLNKVEKRQRFNFGLKFHQKLKRSYFIPKRMNLRSKRRLRNLSLDRLLMRKSKLKKKRRKSFQKLKEEKEEKIESPPPKAEKLPKVENSPRVEIVSVHTNSDDENVDLKNFVDDMLELDKMSEEHRKSVIESRILASSSITNLINKRTTQEADVQKAYKIFSDLSNERKTEEKENTEEEVDQNENSIKEGMKLDENLVIRLICSEHDYAAVEPNDNPEEVDPSDNPEEVDPSDNPEEVDPSDNPEEVEDEEQSHADSLSPVPIPDLEVLPVSKEVQAKSLHSSLTLTNKRRLFLNNYGLHNWNSSNSGQKSNHSISISKSNGSILSACYQDYNLVIVQSSLISFWTQSALGNVLGAQNMWIPKGEIQRMSLNTAYTQKIAKEMVISTETSVAFVELWTKQHKSELRQVPLADVFAIVYFWRLRQNGLEKKALQLENIKGFAEDVQCCVLKSYPRIIVSWRAVQGTDKMTKIRSYHLAADFQTVANISEIQAVQHHVSSLHNIEDCDSLVMGCGENRVTLWNVEYGYVVATIEMANTPAPAVTLWVKCDRGFLFTIQECVDQELRLIAINGMNHTWKKLQTYSPASSFDGLKGVCIENGILVAYYSQGILCWNAQTGELIVEEVPNECEYIPSGKNVIMIANEDVIVSHSLSHLISDL